MKKLAVICALALALILAALNVWFGPLNQDEGWYLYAALLRHEGSLPYRDFFFTQAPLMPLVYGVLSPIWAPFGVLGGRILTAILGLLAAGFTALAAAKLAREKFAAPLIAFLLTACNVYHSYFTVIPKTYALSSLFVSLGVLALASGGKWFFAAGLSFAAAASTRLSLGVLLPATALILLFERKSRGLSWVWFSLGGACGLALFLFPGILADPMAFIFADTFHGARDGGRLIFAAGSFSRLLRNYLPLILLAAFSLRSSFRLFTIPFAAAFALQLAAPFPYDDYQVPLMLIPAAVCAAAAAKTATDKMPRTFLLFVFLAALFAFTSPMNESWFVRGKDRFFVLTKERSELAILREVGGALRKALPPDAEILTQDTYLAVEARRRVPHGFEMGPFGYFPRLAEKAASRYHVLNADLCKQHLAYSDAPIVALSGYSFALAAPEMSPVPAAEISELRAIIAENYTLERIVPAFGQENTTLEIWRKQK